MNELERCPFCGCEVNGFKSHSPECFLVLWVEDSASLNVPHELLAKAWNTRAERTCKNVGYYIDKTRLKCSECDFNGWVRDASIGDDIVPNHCPKCGAKVVE